MAAASHWFTAATLVRINQWDARAREVRDARGVVAFGWTRATPVQVKIYTFLFFSTWRHDRILFDVALHHTEGSFNNSAEKKMCLRATFFCFIDAKGDFFLHCIALHCTACTYACRQVDLLIANQKNFVSIVTVRVPLWKVFSVVTKTTIQRWHTSVAHSWLDAASRRRALHKQAPRQKLGAGGGNQRGDNEATENTKLSTAALHSVQTETEDFEK